MNINNFFSKGGSISVVIIIIVIIAIGVVVYFAFLKDAPLENEILNEPIENSSVDDNVGNKEEVVGITDCIKNGECFEAKFIQCEPATLVAELMEVLAYHYEIIGPKDGLCEVKSQYTANPNPEWVGKEMTCLYDNSQDFKTEFEAMSRCEGPLYRLMTGT